MMRLNASEGGGGYQVYALPDGEAVTLLVRVRDSDRQSGWALLDQATCVK
jgi:hypothetical protein